MELKGISVCNKIGMCALNHIDIYGKRLNKSLQRSKSNVDDLFSFEIFWMNDF